MGKNLRHAVLPLMALIILSGCQSTANAPKLLWDNFYPAIDWPAGGHVFTQPYEVSNPSGFDLCSDYADIRGVKGYVRTTGPHVGMDLCGNRTDAIISTTNGEVTRVAFGNIGETHNVEICYRTDLNLWLSDSHPLKGKVAPITMCNQYLHMTRHFVKPGDKVKRGDPIGLMGDTGSTSAGVVHIHLTTIWYDNEQGASDVRRHGNPHRFWVDGPGKMTCFDPDREYPEDDGYLTLPVRCR